VGADGALADHEPPRDLFVGVTFCDQPQDL
jgi:hypothetical protein